MLFMLAMLPLDIYLSGSNASLSFSLIGDPSSEKRSARRPAVLYNVYFLGFTRLWYVLFQANFLNFFGILRSASMYTLKYRYMRT